MMDLNGERQENGNTSSEWSKWIAEEEEEGKISTVENSSEQSKWTAEEDVGETRMVKTRGLYLEKLKIKTKEMKEQDTSIQVENDIRLNDWEGREQRQVPGK